LFGRGTVLRRGNAADNYRSHDKKILFHVEKFFGDCFQENKDAGDCTNTRRNINVG
jgi:hypothetical protein